MILMLAFTGQRGCLAESGRMVHPPSLRSARIGGRGLGFPPEDDRDRRMGPEVFAGGSGNALRDHLGKPTWIPINLGHGNSSFGHIGCELLGHQTTPRRGMQDRGQHDQGQIPRGDPQDLQHPKRLYPRGGGSDSSRERVGGRVSGFPFLPFSRHDHAKTHKLTTESSR